MKYSEIFEAPITNWEIDQNFDSNEKKLQDRFVGYEKEQLSYSPQDKFGIKSKENIAKIKRAFLHVPYNINLYFYQPTDPNYDNYMEQGVVDYKWILTNMGENVVDYMEKTSNANSITIIITNNLSDQFKIPLKSPWIMAHRISHTLINGTNHIENGMKFQFQFEEFIERIIKKVYGYKWNNWHQLIREEEMQVFGKMLGEIMGTMASARNKKLANYYEWIYESFTQYLINGKVKFNKILPLHFDENMDSTPEKIAMGSRMIARFESSVNKSCDEIMKEAVGKIFVM
jgi:hypothetical protein